MNYGSLQFLWYDFQFLRAKRNLIRLWLQFPLACVPKLLMDSCNGHGQNGFILLLFMAEQDSKLTFDIFIWLAALVKCLVNAYLSYAAHACAPICCCYTYYCLCCCHCCCCCCYLRWQSIKFLMAHRMCALSRCLYSCVCLCMRKTYIWYAPLYISAI